MPHLRKLAIVVLLLAQAGCGPKAPDKSLILWEQPSPEIAARNHAKEIGGVYLYVLPTGSMEPFLTGGDYIVVDIRRPYESIVAGQLLVYQASWLPLSSPWACHMAAAKSGDKWIMDGIANAHYENSANGKLHMGKDEYRGVVVQVYSKRRKS